MDDERLIGIILTVLNWAVLIVVPIIGWLILKVLKNAEKISDMNADVRMIATQADANAAHWKDLHDMLKAQYEALVGQHKQINTRLQSIEEYLRNGKH